MDTLTVAQLIKLLESQDQEAAVKMAGCDCVGEANGVELMDATTVLITGHNYGQEPWQQSGA